MAYFIAIAAFVTGTVAGAVAVRAMPLKQQRDLMGYLNKYVEGILGGNIEPAAWQSVQIANLQSVAFLWLSGLVVVGVVGVLALLFMRGFVIGFSVGFLVLEMQVPGLLFAAASILPHNLVAAPALVSIGALGIAFSLRMAFGQKARGTRERHPVAHYTLSVFLIALLLMVSGLMRYSLLLSLSEP
ncbi:MAG: Stage II sporulation protein M [Firmicutes bacterium]|nr:Stage II sporulation protein M [candidate division NPL-UPA2 bacterium]